MPYFGWQIKTLLFFQCKYSYFWIVFVCIMTLNVILCLHVLQVLCLTVDNTHWDSLLSLNISNFNIILEKNWLSTHRVRMFYYWKWVGNIYFLLSDSSLWLRMICFTLLKSKWSDVCEQLFAELKTMLTTSPKWGQII